MKTRLFATVAMFVVATVCYCVRAGATAEEASAAPPLISPDSNAHNVLVDALAASGYSGQDAADLATNMLKRFLQMETEPFVRSEPLKEGAIPIAPDTHPHNILLDEFVLSGYGAQRAADLATVLLLRIKGVDVTIDTLDHYREASAGWGQCQRYRLLLVYCDAQGERKRKSVYIGTNCWNEYRACWALSAACPTGDMRWATLPTACISGTSCAWVTDQGEEPIWIDCDFGDHFTCQACFGEGPVDCQSIDTRCCPLSMGSSCVQPACPNCDL